MLDFSFYFGIKCDLAMFYHILKNVCCFCLKEKLVKYDSTHSTSVDCCLAIFTS